MERQQTSENHDTSRLDLRIQCNYVRHNSNSTIASTEGELTVDNASVTSSDDSFEPDSRYFQSPYPRQHLEVANPSPVSVHSKNQTSGLRFIESSVESPRKSEKQFPTHSCSKVGMKRQYPALTNSGDKRRNLEIDNQSPRTDESMVEPRSSYLSKSNVSQISGISDGSGEHLVSENQSDSSSSCVSSNVSTNISDRNPPLMEEDELRIGLPVGSLCASEPSLPTADSLDVHYLEDFRRTGVNRITHKLYNPPIWEKQHCTGARPDTKHVTDTSDTRTQVSSDHSDNGIYCIYSPKAHRSNARLHVDEHIDALVPSDSFTPAGAQRDPTRDHTNRTSSQATAIRPNRELMPTERPGDLLHQVLFPENISEFVSVSEQRSSGSPPGVDLAPVLAFGIQEDELSLKSSKCRTCCLVIGMISLFFMIVGGVTVYEILKGNQDPVLQHVYVADIDVKVNETFRDAMSDTTSAEFQQYQNRFCYNVNVSLSPTLHINNCSVHNLSRGSVGVAYRLHFTADRNMTASDLEQLIRKPAEEGTPLAHIGIIKVFANSLRVTSCEDTVEQNTGTNDGSGEPQEEFDCSNTTLRYLPLPYTFDGFCHEYQLCINGKSELFSCAEGHEFSYSENGDSVVCEPASEFTYCGVKRKTLGLTTPTTTAAATTTTQDANRTVLSTSANVPSTAATTDLTSVSTETTTATVYNCTPPVMQENDTCPDHEVSYIPDLNTYPDQCGNYIWCVYGRNYSSHCANGTHFTLGREPCNWAGSPLTYCSTVKRWKDCRQGIVSSTTFEPVTATFPREVMNTFSCAGVKYGFLPMTDTYPYNCGKYHQCVHEAEYIQSCPQGLHFTLQGGVCIPQNSTNTYCEQQKRT